jgi:protein-S-isoprenylcysteine O-methyltransferase Ste14
MAGIGSLLYGILSYLLSLGTTVYAIAFVGNLWVFKTIDTGEAGPLPIALATDTLLLLLFAIQHSVMARPAFKRWWTRFVPWPIERSTYVLFSSLALAFLLWKWRPIPGTVWSVSDSAGSAILLVIFWLGWAIVFTSTFLINHFEFFGLSQVYGRLRGRAQSQPVFQSPLFYKWVRHPLYFGFLLAFWATPAMTAGHLLFASAATGYILVGIHLEERDLVTLFGDRYRRYRERVPMLVPLPNQIWRRIRKGST